MVISGHQQALEQACLAGTCNGDEMMIEGLEL